MRPYEGGVGVDTYTCPACGGIASAPDGCRTCGRPHDPDAAALAMPQVWTSSPSSPQAAHAAASSLPADHPSQVQVQRQPVRHWEREDGDRDRDDD